MMAFPSLCRQISAAGILRLVAQICSPKMSCDPSAFFAVQDDSAKLRIHCMVLHPRRSAAISMSIGASGSMTDLVEPQAVLSDHVQLAAKDRKGLSIHAVRMACKS